MTAHRWGWFAAGWIAGVAAVVVLSGAVYGRVVRTWGLS